MPDYQLTCSSTVDLSLAQLAEYSIAYLPFHFQLNETQYVDDFGQSMTYSEFYTAIKHGAMPTTSQNNPAAYCEFFISFLKAGRDILHIAFSSGLSGDYQSACMAKELLKEQFPDRSIEIIDSLAASSGYGLLLLEVAKQKQQGASLNETVVFALKTRLHIQHWFFSTDLSHYKRGGRISTTTAAIGGALHICPVMMMDAKGMLTPHHKVRGKKKAIRALCEQFQIHVQDLDNIPHCFISHSDCLDDALALETQLTSTFPELRDHITIFSIGTVIGSHTGPGTVSLFFKGDVRH